MWTRQLSNSSEILGVEWTILLPYILIIPKRYATNVLDQTKELGGVVIGHGFSNSEELSLRSYMKSLKLFMHIFLEFLYL